MPLPRAVARFNQRFTNRFLEPLAHRSDGFAFVHHRGRRTGTRYRTPVNVFAAGEEFLVALTYGPGADWVRNVLPGGGELEHQGETFPIVSVGVVSRDETWAHLPILVRIALRVLRLHHFCRLSVGPPNTSL